MKRIFEQRSELPVAKCLIVHVLSSSYNVSKLEFRKKKKATQQRRLCVANDIVLNQVGVYYESVCEQCRKQILVCEVLFLSTLLQNHYQHYFRKGVKIRTEKCKTRSFICEVNLNFLRSSRVFNFYTTSVVNESPLKESSRFQQNPK